MTTQLSDIFEHRPLLFSIAYRMIGEKQEAEDIVQDVYTRWLEMDTDQVEQPRHYLMVNGLSSLALFDAVTQAPVTCICFEHEGDTAHREARKPVRENEILVFKENDR